MDKFERLHELCRREEIRQQKLIGCIIAAFAIALQIFADSIFFSAITLIVCGFGVWMLLSDRLLWDEEDE
jgi:hypothetical protein